ncbi:hypothetical protein ZWY2020_029901 [Hordeum vulgare]|nr:hypothetical protein ZWY2020_029901 [Hordeum vulgare]
MAKMAQAWAAMALADARPLDVFCWLTARIGPLFILWATCVSWHHRALGGGGRRPEPTIAALMGSLCWLAYGHQVIKDTVEPVAVNAWGGTLQAVYLATFLCLCTGEERRRPCSQAHGVRCHLRVPIAHHRDGRLQQLQVTLHHRWLRVCRRAAAHLLAPGMDENTLPPWVMSAFNVVHCFSWCTRGVTKPKPQRPDFYMAVRNSFLPWTTS